MSTCKHVADSIGPYLYGECSQREVAELEEHINTCERCREDVAQRRQVIAALTPEEPTAVERDRILHGLRASRRADFSGATAGRLNLTKIVFQTAGAAVMAFVLFYAGMRVGGQQQTQPETVVRIVKATPPPVVESTPPTPVAIQQPRIHKPAVRRQRPKPVVNSSRRVSSYKRSEMKPVKEMPVERIVAPVPLGIDDIRLSDIEE